MKFKVFLDSLNSPSRVNIPKERNLPNSLLSKADWDIVEGFGTYEMIIRNKKGKELIVELDQRRNDDWYLKASKPRVESPTEEVSSPSPEGTEGL